MSVQNIAATAFAMSAVVATAVSAQSRDQIHIVGSSTVFPFSTAVAEQFGRTMDFRTPIVESTGSGGGLKLFCAGIGTSHPDIANASRRMKASEFETCQANGVTEITEAVIGYDGIVVAGARSGPDFGLTLSQLVIALAENGPKPETWSDIDPALPAIKIEVLGPPPSSGTRDAFEELVMHVGCKTTDLVDCDGVSIRVDGAFVESGENDNLIVSKLEVNPNALGVFGFSFLDQNADALKGAVIDDVTPTFDNIASGDYPIARSMFFYVKNAHVGVVPGLQEYAMEFMSDAAAGEDGYLVDLGLIPLPGDLFERTKGDVANLEPMTAETFN